jgi:hypothetical protein
MKELSAAWLLDAWERYHGEPDQRSAVTLLEDAADPAEDSGSLLDVPVGERDRRLMDLRERLFGSSLVTALACGSCGESMEIVFPLTAVQAPAGDASTSVVASIAGREVRFRLPTTRDLLAVADAVDVASARRELVRRCAVEADIGAMASLADADIDAIEAVMERADPQADVQLESTCTVCGAPVSAPFDILAQLRAELDAWARRTLYEVASLAGSFGWAELDILAMSAWRRQAYLRAAGA